MKKINKIFSCLLACTIFPTLIFTSVSAIKESIPTVTEDEIFLFDEETERHEHSTSSTAETAPPVIQLQTEESMMMKKQKFFSQYHRISQKEDSRINDVHKWKCKVFLYIKTLYKQLQEQPGTITDLQILEFFLDMVKECTNVILPKFDQRDYIIRFDPAIGSSGSIVCSPEGNPHYRLAVL